MSPSEIERTLVRLAHEIRRKEQLASKALGLVGIRRRGVPIAERLGKMIQPGRKEKSSRRHARYHVLSRRPFDAGAQAVVQLVDDRVVIPAAPRAPLSTPFFPWPPQPRPVAGAD